MAGTRVTGPNRRDVLAGGLAVAAGLAMARPVAAQEAKTLARRGVVYDTGTYMGYEGHLSRISWHEADVRRDIAAIATELHCNAIQIAGTEPDRLRLATEAALEQGLQVWLQPRVMERPADVQLAQMEEAARFAGPLAAEGGDIVLNVGCEVTLFQQGIVPGERFGDRIPALFSATGDEAERITRELNAYLARAVETARQHFAGPLTYSAGSWERVDWAPFDLVGVNLYRDRTNRDAYRLQLQGHMSHGKPLVVTEFGCGTFEGAGEFGAASFMIVDYSVEPPRIPDQFVRSEEEQAREIAEQLQIFAEEGVEGAFVYNFLSQFDWHHEDPRRDIDMASHAIVKVAQTAADAPLTWEPKAAFHEVARLYQGFAEA